MLTLLVAASQEVVEGSGPHFPISATLVYVIGFIAATTLGSIAWYNSKRPVGWEDKERPDVVPEVDSEV